MTQRMRVYIKKCTNSAISYLSEKKIQYHSLSSEFVYSFVYSLQFTAAIQFAVWSCCLIARSRNKDKKNEGEEILATTRSIISFVTIEDFEQKYFVENLEPDWKAHSRIRYRGYNKKKLWKHSQDDENSESARDKNSVESSKTLRPRAIFSRNERIFLYVGISNLRERNSAVIGFYFIFFETQYRKIFGKDIHRIDRLHKNVVFIKIMVRRRLRQKNCFPICS